MSRKEVMKRILITVPIVALLISITSMVIVHAVSERSLERVSDLEARFENVLQATSKQRNESVASIIKKHHELMSKRVNSTSDISIRITTPDSMYEFTDLNLLCNEFVMDNDLWYAQAISPYISPGVEWDDYVRVDSDDGHWIKMHVVNTASEDVATMDCTVFTIGFKNCEGYSINGITAGDEMEDIIVRLGKPDEFSISDSNKITGLTYDYGNFRINVVAGVYDGRVDYVEAVCTNTDGYSNGRWK